MKRAILNYFGVDEGAADEFTVLRELLLDLSRSEVRYMLLNLEDLWLETDSQNLPGTGLERPNWRGKTRLMFEQFSTAPDVLQVLGEIASNRSLSLDDR